jgi:hypothetical protein
MLALDGGSVQTSVGVEKRGDFRASRSSGGFDSRHALERTLSHSSEPTDCQRKHLKQEARMPEMTDAEVVEALRADTALNRARQVFSAQAARMEQQGMQRWAPGPVEMRRMEFEAVRKIAEALGVSL